MRVFVSGTGTGVGKTYVSRALALAHRARGESVSAIKPIETGCDPDPLDAVALAVACGQPELAHAPGFYRVRPALGPLSATRSGETPLDVEGLLSAITPYLSASNLIVEGAGGLLVPLTDEATILELVVALRLPLLLVAEDGLGVQSYVLSAVRCALARDVKLAAVVLRQPAEPDPSTATNVDVLAGLINAPVIGFSHVESDRELEAQGRLILSRMLRFP
ncbi:MAG TPA: dethiobiotin synthase [Polyangiaceae bacterium]|nr:dethiobiotin synthase [Polyangiaceae bacterium]